MTIQQQGYIRAIQKARIRNRECKLFLSSELKNGLSQKGLAEKVFFDDNATYLGNLLECEFGAGVMLWGSCIYGLHSYLILEENGEDPKLVIYKKR